MLNLSRVAIAEVLRKIEVGSLYSSLKNQRMVLFEI
jgi:hypothetical protein